VRHDDAPPPRSGLKTGLEAFRMRRQVRRPVSVPASRRCGEVTVDARADGCTQSRRAPWPWIQVRDPVGPPLESQLRHDEASTTLTSTPERRAAERIVTFVAQVTSSST
jgi:hypothetical protein